MRPTFTTAFTMRRRLLQFCRCAWLLLGLLSVGRLAAAEPADENLALQMDGSRGSVELPTNLLDGLTEATLEGWFRWDRFGYFSQPVAFGEESRSAGINLFRGRAEVQFYLYTEQGAPKVLRSSGAVQLGEWVHLATVFGRAGMRLYVNGMLAGTNAHAGMPPGGRKWLGRAVWAENEPFFGALDELRLWRTARSAEQINATLGQRLTGREANLVALWNFDQRQPDDATTNGFRGRLTGEVNWIKASQPDLAALQRPAVIAGKLVNAAGAPLANAEVQLWRDSKLADRIVTDEEGEFSFAVLAGAKFSLAAKSGELGARVDDFEAKQGERREFPLVAGPALSITGVVRARDGTPQPHAVVQALRARADGSFTLEAMARSRGVARFAFASLAPGRYRLRCSSMFTNYYLPKLAGTVCTDPAEAAELEVSPGQPAAQVEFRLPVLKRGQWRRYTFHDGLADNRVTALGVGADDVLWVATEAGLSRFDGKSFQTFSPPNLHISALTVARDGTLWLGTAQGLARFDGTRFTLVPGTTPSSLKFVQAVVEGADGAVWVAADSGLHRWQQERWTHYTAADGLGSRFVNDLALGPQDELWIATRGGVTRWDSTGGQLQRMPDRLFPQVGISKLQAAPDGVWCGFQGMVAWIGGEAGAGTVAPQDFGDAVGLMRRTRGGVMWFGVVNGGLYRCEGDRVVAFGEGDTFSLLNVSSLAETRDGRLWFGTLGGGLACFDETGVVNYTARDGLPSRPINALARDAQGRLWIASGGDGLLRLRGEHLEAFTKNDGLPDNEVLSLKTAPDGTLWVGTAAGLARVSRDGRRIEEMEPSFKARVDGLEFGPDGEVLLVAGGFGLMRWREGRVENLNAETGLSGRYGGMLFRDRSGTLWRSGFQIRRLTDGTLKMVSETEGLAGAQVNGLAEGPDGTLWAATTRGLRVVRNGRFEEPSVPSPLGHSGLPAVAAGRDGHLWVGSIVGAGLFDGTAWSTLDLRDGLPGERVRALLCEPDGTVWMGVDDGLARLRPNRAGPRVTVERVESAGRPVGLGGVPQLVTGQAAEFFFAAADFKTHPAKRQFRHRLYPSAATPPPWSAPTTASALNWTPPSPGQFRLEVQAIDRDLNYSEPVQFRFDTAWPWHRNPWVIWPGTLAVLLLAALAVGYGWRYTVHRREALALRFEVAAQERAEQEHRAFARQLIETQEAERKRIAAELHDGLGQNLLVVKGRTTLALGLSLSPEVRDHVEEISAVTAQALAEAREISHNLRPHQLDSLGLAKAVRAMARKVCEAAGLKLEIEVDGLVGVLAATQEIQLYRVAQEALNNVAKHSGAKTVRVSLRREPERVTLEIRDDGHGFVRRETPRTDGGGFGLVTMQERMNLIGGTLVLDSTPGTGTRLVAEIPLAKS